MPNRNWFLDWFNSPYYYLLYQERNETEAFDHIIKILSHLNPPTQSTMLDVACGKGRHSKALADQGFDVTGIDLSITSIEEAKQEETGNLRFYQHDMRLPFWINYFDYAFNLFTSFGYFSTEREHNNAIRTIAQSLVSNGYFIMDYLNVHYAEDNLEKKQVKVVDGTRFHLTKWHDTEHFFKQVQVEEKGTPLKHLYTEKVAKFSLGDFTDMFAYQGLQVQEVFGDYDLAAFNIRTSPRMIIIAKKVRR